MKVGTGCSPPSTTPGRRARRALVFEGDEQRRGVYSISPPSDRRYQNSMLTALLHPVDGARLSGARCCVALPPGNGGVGC